MKPCAYCGRDNEDNATHCRECGNAEFVVLTAPSSATQPEMAQRMSIPDPEPDVSPTGESALCTSCLFPNVPGTAFCKRCGAPVGFISTIGPLEHIYAEGHAYRQAVEGRPKPIILIGIWLLFFPSLLVCLRLMFSGGKAAPLFILIFGGMAWICIMMLYRATKNYMKPRQEARDKGDT